MFDVKIIIVMVPLIILLLLAYVEISDIKKNIKQLTSDVNNQTTNITQNVSRCVDRIEKISQSHISELQTIGKINLQQINRMSCIRVDDENNSEEMSNYLSPVEKESQLKPDNAPNGNMLPISEQRNTGVQKSIFLSDASSPKVPGAKDSPNDYQQASNTSGAADVFMKSTLRGKSEISQVVSPEAISFKGDIASRGTIVPPEANSAKAEFASHFLKDSVLSESLMVSSAPDAHPKPSHGTIVPPEGNHDIQIYASSCEIPVYTDPTNLIDKIDKAAYNDESDSDVEDESDSEDEDEITKEENSDSDTSEFITAFQSNQQNIENDIKRFAQLVGIKNILDIPLNGKLSQNDATGPLIESVHSDESDIISKHIDEVSHDICDTHDIATRETIVSPEAISHDTSTADAPKSTELRPINDYTLKELQEIAKQHGIATTTKVDGKIKQYRKQELYEVLNSTKK